MKLRHTPIDPHLFDIVLAGRESAHGPGHIGRTVRPRLGDATGAGGQPRSVQECAKAEDAALRLGSRLAEAGDATEIRIYLRDGTLAGRFLCPARLPVEA